MLLYAEEYLRTLSKGYVINNETLRNCCQLLSVAKFVDLNNFNTIIIKIGYTYITHVPRA